MINDFRFFRFDTSATAMNFIMYQLATHEEIQEKAQKEVLEMIKKHGKLSYEALMDMEYLNQIFSGKFRRSHLRKKKPSNGFLQSP